MPKTDNLYILWTNDNLITSEFMVFMYAINAKKNNWWSEVTLIIWGATAKLVQENRKIQDLIKEAKREGVHISACKACAKKIGAFEKLRELDIEVVFWGEPLTQLLKDGEKIITI